jgi:DNA-binding MarR family transcriptional regulator
MKLMAQYKMDEGKLLEDYLKALADERRLWIIGLLAIQEQDAGQLADKLELTRPDISHHLNQLREVGLVTMRADGNHCYFRLDKRTLERFKSYTANVETVTQIESAEEMENNTAWLDALKLDDWEREVLVGCIRNGRIRQIPIGDKLQVVLRWIASQFETGRIYKEREVNEMIGRFHDDVLVLRREMVDAGYLQREMNGSAYWIAASPLK